MKLRYLAVMNFCLFLTQAAPAAPTVSNVAASITSYTNQGAAMKVRHFNVTFNLANTNGKNCRIWPAVRGVEKNPVLADEGPVLFWKNLAGDTSCAAGTGKHITFDVIDTAGEFNLVKVKVTAWDRDGWAPMPNRPYNPRHHHWNLDVRRAPVASNSSAICQSMQSMHQSWNCWLVFPVYQVMGNHQKVSVSCNYGCDQTDHVSTPIPAISLGDPADAAVEGSPPSPACNGGDCHMIIVDVENWIGYDHYLANRLGPLNYEGSAAQFFYTQETYSDIDGSQGAYRCMGCTSSDAAGLSLTPGLIRLQDIADGEIQTALRFTTQATDGGMVHPASHVTDGGSELPMGGRLRLKASVDINTILPLGTGTRDVKGVRMILRALQKYGMIMADNGMATCLMGEADNHQELKWSTLLSAGAFARINSLLASPLTFTKDFEVVSGTWQFQQYTNYENKK